MPTTNARKHIIPTGDEASFTREVFFKQFGQSINDIVPVANTTARQQLVDALNALTPPQGPSSTRPLVVARTDAPGLHRIEYSFDGVAWVPLSGVLRFASKAAADSFGTSYPGLLSENDFCFVGEDRYTWSGSAWLRFGALESLSANTVSELEITCIGDRIFVEGRIYKSGGNVFATDELVGVIQSGFRPARAEVFIASTVYTSGSQWGIAPSYIESNGNVRVNRVGAAIATAQVIGFNGSWRRA